MVDRIRRLWLARTKLGPTLREAHRRARRRPWHRLAGYGIALVVVLGAVNLDLGGRVGALLFLGAVGVHLVGQRRAAARETGSDAPSSSARVQGS